MVIVKIKDKVGPYCVSRVEGDKVYENLLSLWEEHDKIVISFEGVEIATLSFLNAAFSPFFFDYALNEVLSKLQFIDISPKDKYLLNKTIKVALEQSNQKAVNL